MSKKTSRAAEKREESRQTLIMAQNYINSLKKLLNSKSDQLEEVRKLVHAGDLEGLKKMFGVV